MTAPRRRGLTYHHIGIPTTTPWPGEVHVEHLKMHVVGFDTSPFGVEWLRFDPDRPMPELVRTVPHVTFVVDDGAPVELLAFDGPEHEVWPGARSEPPSHPQG